MTKAEWEIDLEGEIAAQEEFEKQRADKLALLLPGDRFTFRNREYEFIQWGEASRKGWVLATFAEDHEPRIGGRTPQCWIHADKIEVKA